MDRLTRATAQVPAVPDDLDATDGENSTRDLPRRGRPTCRPRCPRSVHQGRRPRGCGRRRDGSASPRRRCRSPIRQRGLATCRWITGVKSPVATIRYFNCLPTSRSEAGHSKDSSDLVWSPRVTHSGLSSVVLPLRMKPLGILRFSGDLRVSVRWCAVPIGQAAVSRVRRRTQLNLRASHTLRGLQLCSAAPSVPIPGAEPPASCLRQEGRVFCWGRRP